LEELIIIILLYRFSVRLWFLLYCCWKWIRFVVMRRVTGLLTVLVKGCPILETRVEEEVIKGTKVKSD